MIRQGGAKELTLVGIAGMEWGVILSNVLSPSSLTTTIWLAPYLLGSMARRSKRSNSCTFGTFLHAFNITEANHVHAGSLLDAFPRIPFPHQMVFSRFLGYNKLSGTLPNSWSGMSSIYDM